MRLLSGSRQDLGRDQRHSEEMLALQEQLKTALLRFELAGKSEGLWDMEYPADGELLPDTPFWWSEHFRKLLGFRDETDFPNILDSWGSRLHRDDKDRTFAAFAAHLKDKSGQTPYDIEYRLQLKSGEYRWFLARGYTLRDGRGNPMRVAGSLRDINTEKLLNQRLRVSKDELQSAMADVKMKMDSFLNQAVQTAQASNRQMSGLHARSNEIRKVNGIISEIAFTSNILALNAMIEAARGRGWDRLHRGCRRGETASCQNRICHRRCDAGNSRHWRRYWSGLQVHRSVPGDPPADPTNTGAADVHHRSADNGCFSRPSEAVIRRHLSDALVDNA